MNNLSRYTVIFLIALLTQFQTNAQNSGFTMQPKQQLSADQDVWMFGFSAGGAFPIEHQEKDLFRGNGLATKFFAKHFWGNVGLAASSGVMTGRISETSLDQFIKERSFSREQMNVTTADPHNAYLMFGPSVRFGNKVLFDVDVQGGLFLNDAGMVDIAVKGENRSMYRFANGTKNYAAGFSGSLSINYPINSSTHFFINSDYLQTIASVNMLDLKSGLDVAAQFKRNVRTLTAGIGIVKSFGRSGNSGRRHEGNVKYQNMSTAMSGGNCGPVTMSMSSPDGSVQQLTFSCPEDALAFSQGNEMRSINQNNYMPLRQGMTPNPAKQTPGQPGDQTETPGLQSGTGMISGNISWQQSPLPQIITNDMAALPSNSTTGVMEQNHNEQIINAVFYLREGKKTKAEPAYNEQLAQQCNGCGLQVTAVSGTPAQQQVRNPLYNSGNQGTNPMHEKNAVNKNPLYQEGTVKENPLYNGNKLKGNGDYCGTTDHLIVSLYDANGRKVSKTMSDSCGNFWFDHVPEGAYRVALTGTAIVKKSYEIALNKEGVQSVEGLLATGDAELLLVLNGQETDSTFMSQKVIVRGWDVQKKDMYSGNGSGNAASQRVAGTPIGGIIVKGGKNPGGQMKTVETDNDGHFVMTNLAKGNYTISVEIPYVVNESTIVVVGQQLYGGGDPHEALNGIHVREAKK